jgi:hypothetical protein
MKANLFVLAICLFLSSAPLIGQSRILGEFRGIKWGSSPDTVIAILISQKILDSSGEQTGFERQKKEEGDEDDIPYYEKPFPDVVIQLSEEKLVFYEFWPDVSSNNRYSLYFINNGLESVSCTVESGISGFRASFDVLSSKYGKPTKILRAQKTLWGQPEPSYQWEFTNANITLRYNPSDGVVSTSGRSKILYQTKKSIQFEKSKKDSKKKKIILESKSRF